MSSIQIRSNITIEELYVAKQAYEQKTATSYSYLPSINYESFFNKTLWGAKAILAT